MFYILVCISILGYSIQGTLIVAFSRRHDPLSLAVYRNVALIFIMLPLLVTASANELSLIPSYIPSILATGVSGTLGLAVMFRSVNFLAVGISTGIRQTAGVLFSIVLGMLFFSEKLTWVQLLAILVLLLGVLILSKSHNPMPHLDSNTAKGISLSFLSGLLIAFAFFMMGKLSRDVGPAVSGYILEASIGVCSLALVYIRKLTTDQHLETISIPTFLKICLASSPTLLGTGAAAWAISIGPFGEMRAYSATGILITVLISHFIYNEKLRSAQWTGIMITIAGIIGLRLG